MKIETDPKRISEFARRMEDVNWAFRCFLKASDLTIEHIDSTVHKLYKAVSAQIDCRQCANCCKIGRPLLTRKDIKRLAAHLAVSKEHFVTEYLVSDEENEGHFFRSMPCPFLRENLCMLYSCRPDDCRSYPHLQKKEFVFRLNQAFSNCSVCPIVFNVYDRLKHEIRFNRLTW